MICERGAQCTEQSVYAVGSQGGAGPAPCRYLPHLLYFPPLLFVSTSRWGRASEVAALLLPGPPFSGGVIRRHKSSREERIEKRKKQDEAWSKSPPSRFNSVRLALDLEVPACDFVLHTGTPRTRRFATDRGAMPSFLRSGNPSLALPHLGFFCWWTARSLRPHKHSHRGSGQCSDRDNAYKHGGTPRLTPCQPGHRFSAWQGPCGEDICRWRQR